MTRKIDDLSAVQRIEQRSALGWGIALGCVALALLIAFTFYRQISRISIPVPHANDEEYFKYGSIGSDVVGVPYWVFATLPEICPSLLPGGYASLGVIQEPGKPTPIGFSIRRVGPVDIAGPNCALCHTGTVRATRDAEPMVYPTAPAHQLNLMGYFKFLFACARDPNFTADNVLTAIGRHTSLSLVDRVLYRYLVVPQVQQALIAKGAKFDAIAAGRPEWGPGRVDTFNPYKVLVFNLDMSHDSSIGTARFMSIWEQGAQEGMWHHWDGNNDSLDERNYSAAIGAGVALDPATFDVAGIERIKQWLLPRAAPKYPFPIDLGLAAQGRPIYARTCAGCHEPGADHFGGVTPIGEIGTDPERLRSFDPAMAARMNTIGGDAPWAFHRFRSTNGYANHSLAGIWLRAPYLHNGSVPTLADLLLPESQRPQAFYVGDDLYDQAALGFVSNVATGNGRAFDRFDTRARGNANTGHNYGTGMSAQDRAALLEYLKTL